MVAETGHSGSQTEALFGVDHSIRGRRWRLNACDDRRVSLIVQKTGVDDSLARLLASRDVNPDEAQSFLDPRLRDYFPDPSSFTDMDKAAGLIWDALKAGQRIAIFADYDVDGATSAAQLGRWLRAMGQEPLIYVPDRLEEGYGPNEEAFRSLQAKGAELVITLDCGAAAIEPLKTAEEMGLPVIVIDHHLMKDEAPPARALVNPNQPGDMSGCGHMAAAGVTFVLLAALNREGRRREGFGDTPEPDILALADLAALGTICDVVSLTGINRAIVTQGLKVMSQWKRPGLAALARIASVEGPASTYHAGFIIGPRINAGGRVGQSDLGARLLMSENPDECEEIAQALDQYNAERKAIEAEVQDEALKDLEQREIVETTPILIATGEGWHPGVIGIAAGRIKERFNRPVLVIGFDEDGLGKGSGRSVPGVNLGAAISAAQEEGLLVTGGGHAMAAGLTIARDKLDAFQRWMTERLQAEWDTATEARCYDVDLVMSPSGAKFETVADLQKAGPYGQGHREPRVAFSDMTKTYAERVGQDHVRFSFENASGRISGICFRCADDPLGQALLGQSSHRWHIAGRLKAQDNRYGRKVDLHLEDMALAG